MSLLAELKRRNVIRVAIAYMVLTWLVLQVADVLANSLDLPATLGKMVLAIMAIGLLPVMVFAWIYELTPEGIKREKDIPVETSITDHTAKRLDIAVIVLLVIAIGLFVGDRLVGPSTTPVIAEQQAQAAVDDKVSIAVLPFLNLSDDSSNEYFSDGLTETLLNMLAQVEQLRVAARTSAFAFKGANSDIREIASQLGVSAVLEGSVQRAGAQVRVTAQLIDATSGSQIWSQSYDRTMDDIFAIQDEIANSVVSALAQSLLGDNVAVGALANGPQIESLSTRSTEAYEFYLRGLAPKAEGSHASLPLAEQAFTEALLIDPEFREARIALTETYIAMGDTAFISSSEAVSRAQSTLAPLTDSAGDDPLVAGLASYVAFLEVRSRRFVGLEQSEAFFNELTTAVARAPNEPVLYIALAEVLQTMDGRQKEQLGFIERGLQVDPFNGSLLVWKGRVLGRMNRLDDTLAAYARLREVAPDNPNGYALPYFIHQARGDVAKAAAAGAAGAAVDRRDHELPAFVSMALTDMNLHEEAAQWLSRAKLLDPDGGATLAAELLHLHFTGQGDAALQVAERLVRSQRTNRRGAYYTAALIYGNEMYRRERTGEALELFEELAPGSATDIGYVASDQYSRQLMFTARLLRSDPYTDEEIEQWMAANAERFDSLVPDWREADSMAGVRYRFLGLSLDEAAAAMAKELSDVGNYLALNRLVLEFPAMQDLVSHPDVQTAIAVTEDKLQQEAEKFRNMVAAGDIPGA